MSQPKPQRNWRVASAISVPTLIALLILSSKCWRYAPLARTVAFVALPPLLLFAFVLLRWTARIIFAVLIVVCSFVFLSPHLNPVPAAQAESSAVAALLQMQSALQQETINEGRRNLTQSLPRVKTSFPLHRFYDFAYHAHASGSEFEITATVTAGARSCGCVHSFMITSRGDVHDTTEDRMATVIDDVVDVPVGLRNAATTR